MCPLKKQTWLQRVVRCAGSERLALCSPRLASDELEVFAESGVVSSFPSCSRFGGHVAPTGHVVAICLYHPDLATATSEVRVFIPLPDVAAIGADETNPTALGWLFFFALCACLLSLSGFVSVRQELD